MPSVISKKNHILEPAKPSAGLFDRIIYAIKLEQERQQTKKLLSFFIVIFSVSVGTMPFSFNLFLSQWNESGINYFISLAIENFTIFLSLWQDFTLSILESLPILAIAVFAINIALLLFTIRLFLYKKGLLLKYIKSIA